MTVYSLGMSNIRICIQKSCPLRVIVPTAQIIQPGFLIVHIATIPERIDGTQRICHCASLAQNPALGIVPVFYHPVPVAVNQRDHVAL